MPGGTRGAYLALAALLTALYVPAAPASWSSWIYILIELVAVAAIWVGLATNRPRAGASWVRIAAGFTAWFVGDTFLTVVTVVTGEQPWVSLADAWYVVGYAALAAGLAGLVPGHRSQRDLDSLIDSLAIFAAGLLVMWQLVISSAIADTSTPATARWLAVTYAVLDAVLLALVGRAWLAAERRHAAVLCVGAAVAVVFVADSIFSVMAQSGTYSAYNTALLDVGWTWSIVLAGLAFLDPSLGSRIGRHDGDRAPGLRRLLITGTALLAPVALPMLDAVKTRSSISVAATCGGVVLMLLAGWRVIRLSHAGARWEAAVVHQQAYFRAMVQHSSDAVVVLAKNGRVLDTTPSIESVVGHPRDELVGVDAIGFVHPADRELALATIAATLDDPTSTQTRELRIVQGDGSARWFEARITNLRHDVHVSGIVLNLHDIDERKRVEAELSRLAFHDSLTGLPNRALLHDRTGHSLARRAREPAHEVAVLFCDLDGFKHVNDTFGHAAGDVVLRSLADRLTSIVRASDTIARLGGDEFAILLDGAGAATRAADVAMRVLDAVRAPLSLDGTEFVLGVSIGLATAEPATRGADDLLRDADLAMYAAKESGKHRLQVFVPAMRDTAMRRLTIEADLRRAVQRGELRLRFQPVVALATGALTGFEALVRWEHPQRGTLLPDEFIPVAERSGLIVPIGEWVLSEACRVAAGWPVTRGEAPLSIAVNASAREIAEPGYVHRVELAMAAARLDPERVIVEITETALADDATAVAAALHRLKALQIRIAIDDFGTGYSSLAYLEQFPIDILKIDRTFVKDVRGADGELPAMLRGLFELGRALGLELLAEGIEDVDQLDRLSRAGFELGQGFLFAAALDEAEAAALLDRPVPLTPS